MMSSNLSRSRDASSDISDLFAYRFGKTEITVLRARLAGRPLQENGLMLVVLFCSRDIVIAASMNDNVHEAETQRSGSGFEPKGGILEALRYSIRHEGILYQCYMKLFKIYREGILKDIL